MKLRISILFILLGIFVSTAQAQSNCCQIVLGGVQITGGQGSVPPNGNPGTSNGPGGVYVATETETYPVACKNTQTNSSCNSTSVPNNVVTATGAGANYNGTFVACNPTFAPVTSQSSSTSGTAASFKDQGTGYTSVDSNGACVQQNPQPFAISTCIVVACSGSTSGGGTTCKTYCSDPDVVCPRGCLSPIVIDVSGQGFVLTDANGGVLFDIAGDGHPIQMGWTAPGANNAFLALPGADGLVHSGQQLFGNFTAQPASTLPNGFAALAVYDLPANGGNGDGIIDSRDAIFASLRLWIDANHDGISQPEELHTLPSLGVNSISLTYKWDWRTDQYGNGFRYRGQVNPGNTTNTGRMAYDVFFVTLGQASSKNIPGSLIPAACPVPASTKGGVLSTGSR